MFDPQSQYEVAFKEIPLREFVEYQEEFVVRPPYQRKSVWSRGKQQELLDSLFRRFYVPRIVVREVRLDEESTVREIIDGQQRIITAQRFLSDDLPLPNTLQDIHKELPGKYFSQLPADLRRFVDRELGYSADIVRGIEDPKDPEHQRIATEIFWRLQQGESLNYMEVAHARLSSLSRNFVVHYADDIHFDYKTYRPVDENKDKHPFFRIINQDNNRMQHLSLLTRFLILEDNEGPTDVQNGDVRRYIDQYQVEDGIGNLSFKDRPQAKAALSNLNSFYNVFKDDPMVSSGDVVRELKREYFLISSYLLLRHLRKYYVFDAGEQELFSSFLRDFYQRWQERSAQDTDILMFSDNRQQTGNEIATRHMILRQIFFEYATQQHHEMKEKDSRRAFNESERILLYRIHEGRCQQCLRDGKPKSEAFVLWGEFEADHVLPHSKGGETSMNNAEVLCRYHNQQKGATVG